jgi:hypothetical protein
MANSPFDNPTILARITADVSRIQSSWLEWNAEPTTDDFDAKIGETLVDTLDAHARAYLEAVDGNPPAPPRLRRLIVNDATFEALHQTMSQNPWGVLLLRDEIVGWLAGLDKAGHETERAFCLEAWNGKNPYTVDRIGRGTIHVPACCMSLFGGIQPGRLRSYLADALQDGPSNDGLIQRFQLLVWPDLDTWEYVDRSPNIEAQELAARVFRRLVEMG